MTEHNRYAAVMLLSDVRRRLHNEIKYVDLLEKFTSMPSKNLSRYKQPLTCWAHWILGVRQVRLVPDDNSVEAGLIDATGDNGLGVLLGNGLRTNHVFGNKSFIARFPIFVTTIC